MFIRVELEFQTDEWSTEQSEYLRLKLEEALLKEALRKRVVHVVTKNLVIKI